MAQIGPALAIIVPILGVTDRIPGGGWRERGGAGGAGVAHTADGGSLLLGR